MKQAARLFLFLLFLAAPPAAAQHTHSHSHDRVVNFPDVPGYHTMKVDLHMHTVFSDGHVWPNIRVQEAIRDGLDAIAITEHLEYQPHREDIPHPDRNRAYEIARRVAGDGGLLVIAGSEITRSMPPGHANAIFIEDANALLLDDPVDVFREAKRQGAFIFWNHPMWINQRPDGMATLTELHRELIEEGVLDGIEVVNDLSYSEEALQIALEHDLTILGTSDIHGLVDWQYHVPEGGHRPLTLAFSESKSAEGLREALDAGRTAVWFENLLIGKEENVLPLLHASIAVRGAAYVRESSVLRVEVENLSDAEFLMRNRSGMTFDTHASVLSLRPHATTTMLIRTQTRQPSIELPLEVLNAVIAPGRHPTVSLRIEVD